MPDNKYGKKAFKYSGLLRSFFAWPLYIGAVLIIICAIMFCVNVTAATVVSIFMVIYLMACGLMYFYMRPRIMSGIVEFAIILRFRSNFCIISVCHTVFLIITAMSCGLIRQCRIA